MASTCVDAAQKRANVLSAENEAQERTAGPSSVADVLAPIAVDMSHPNQAERWRSAAAGIKYHSHSTPAPAGPAVGCSDGLGIFASADGQSMLLTQAVQTLLTETLTETDRPSSRTYIMPREQNSLRIVNL